MNTSLVKLASAENPIITSIQAETFDDKKRFYNAVNNPVGDVTEIINQPVTVTDFHMKHETKTNDDGVEYDGLTTTIILDDGRSYKTTYRSFAKSLINLLSVFGTPDIWDNHRMTVIIKTVKYGGGMHDGLTIDIS